MEARRTVSLFALLVVAGCSGATETELFGPATQDRSTTEPTGSSGDTGAATGESGQATPSTSSDPAPPTKQGDENGNAKGDSQTPPPPPPPTSSCVAEIEPNDGPELANAFTSCFSGALKRGDLDYARIVAPANATTMKIEHTEDGGSVWYRIYVNGTPYPAFTGQAPSYIPAIAGARYDFEMSPSTMGGGNRSYQLNVTFE